MSYHHWGDEWFEENGDDLYKAINYIVKYVHNTSYCYLICKEKYGSMRFEHVWPIYDPTLRKIRIKVPFYRKKTSYLSLPVYLFTWDTSRLRAMWIKYGWKKTLEATLSAIEKWPHLEDELMSDLAINKNLVGPEIHAKYWTSVSNDKRE